MKNRLHTTSYLGYPIVQKHSIQEKARDILKHNKRANFTRISFNGVMGSGKTSGIKHLTHLLHTLAINEFKTNYSVKWIDPETLLDPARFAKNITNTNQILILDDASYVTEMMGKFTKAKLKHNVTKIRHIDDDVDSATVNIILIVTTHYTKAYDKMLRDVDFRFFTTITPEEKRNVSDIVGKNFVLKFMARLRQMEKNGKAGFQLTQRDPKDVIWYRDGDPFRLMMYHSKFETQLCVFCHPASIKSHQLHCNLCDPDYNGIPMTEQEFIHAVELADKSTGKQYARAAMKFLLFNLGETKYLYRSTYKSYFFALQLLQKYKINPMFIGMALEENQKRKSTDHRKHNKKITENVESTVMPESSLKV